MASLMGWWKDELYRHLSSESKDSSQGGRFVGFGSRQRCEHYCEQSPVSGKNGTEASAKGVDSQ